MKHISLRFRLLVLSVVAFGIWSLAADIPYGFKAGDVISAEQMNANFTALNEGKQDRVEGQCAAGSAIRSITAEGAVVCEVDDIGTGGGAGVDTVNGMTGAVTLQAGDNITIDDSILGQLVISATEGGIPTNEHAHFGQTWMDAGSGIAGLSVDNTSSSQLSTGVFGGSTSRGVGIHGRTAGTTGVAPGFGAGVWGEGGIDSYGVFAHSAGNISLYAQNDTRAAIKGQSASGDGVWGESTSGRGVLGRTSGSGEAGVRGETVGSTVGYGVFGTSTTGIGVFGQSTSNAGVFGRSVSNNAAFFTGGSGGLGSCSYNGGAGWNCTSDRNAKENFRAVDPGQVLEQLAAMPIHQWTMIGDLTAAPHLGPTAQDFRAAFSLGDSETTINSADAQGVALAAIQGLFAVVQEQSRQIETLQAEVDALRNP